MQLRMVWLGVAILSAACGGSPAPAPAPPTTTAPPAAAPPPAPDVTEAPASPHRRIDDALAKMSAFRDEFCKCTDKPCADRVTEDMTRWGQEMAKDSANQGLVSEDDAKQMAAITEEMTKCMTRAMMASLQPAPADATAAPATDGPPQQVAPTALDSHRLAGDKLIVPDDDDKVAMTKRKLKKVTASVKLCVDKAGDVFGIEIAKSSGLPGYDAKLVRELGTWRYSPFAVNGKVAAVCTAITFIYAQSP